MTHKITVIGAGSAVFSLNLVRDLCLTPNLSGSTIALMDIDSARLDAIHQLCTRYAAEIGTQLHLEKTTDRREALDGADIVVNAALTASHSRLRDGWAIARPLGYRWGGSLHVMHDEAFWINFYQLKLFESVIEDVLALCPSAYYVQVANPVMAGITHLARTYPETKIVGLCHGWHQVHQVMATLGLDPARCTYEIPGVNHFVWLTKLAQDGQDAMPRLRAWAESELSQHFARCGTNHGVGPKAVDLFKRMDAFPIGDTGTWGGGSWGWWYHLDDATEHRWQEAPAQHWQRYFDHGISEVADIRRIAQDSSTRVSAHFPPKRSHEVIVPMIEALVCDVPRVLIGNVPNAGGHMPGVPNDFAVEVPIHASGSGLRPQHTDGLPPAPLAYLLRDCVDQVNLELAAYTRRDKRLLLELLMMDPWTRSESQAQQLLDGVFALPYHAELRQHFG